MNNTLTQGITRIFRGDKEELVFVFKTSKGLRIVTFEVVKTRSTVITTAYVDGGITKEAEEFVEMVYQSLGLDFGSSINYLPLKDFGDIVLTEDVSNKIPGLWPIPVAEYARDLKAIAKIQDTVLFEDFESIPSNTSWHPIDSTLTDWDAKLLAEAVANLESAKVATKDMRIEDPEVTMALDDMKAGLTRTVIQVGPTGTGKTTNSVYYSAKVNQPIFYMVGTPNGDEGTYISSWSPSEDEHKNYELVMKVIAVWALHGGTLVIDEPNVILNGGVLTALNNLIEYPFRVTLENGNVISLHDNCRLFLNYNPNYEGTIPLNFSVKNRAADILVHKDISLKEVKYRLKSQYGWASDAITDVLFKDIYTYLAQAVKTEMSSGVVSYRQIQNFICSVLYRQQAGATAWEIIIPALVKNKLVAHCFGDIGYEAVENKMEILKEPVSKIVSMLVGSFQTAMADSLFYDDLNEAKLDVAANAIDTDFDADLVIDGIIGGQSND